MVRTRSAEAANAGWCLNLIREHAGGRSNIRHSGALALAAGIPHRLSLTVLDHWQGERCTIEIELFEGDRKLRTFRFDCPH